ncbi:MAG: AI-2E family transporter [Sulfobacillus sp.]
MKLEARLSPLRWYRWGLLVVLSGGSILLLWYTRAILLPFVLALVLAYLLAPLVESFVRHGLNRIVSIMVVYILVGFVIAAAIIYMVPLLIQESIHLIRMVPGFANELQSTWSIWLARLHQAPIPSSVRSAISATGMHLENQLFGLLRALVGAIFGLVPGVVSVIVAPVLGFYVLKDLDRIRMRFWDVVPLKWRSSMFKLGFDMDRALNGFIRGQLIVALAVGALSTILVVILGIPFPLLIGAVATVTDIIPYVGPIAGALPAVVLALNISPLIALDTVLGFVAIHQLEGTVIGPKVMGESVGLHPLVVVFAILAGGELGGVVGLLLAVPTAAVLKVFLSHLYRRFTI